MFCKNLTYQNMDIERISALKNLKLKKISQPLRTNLLFYEHLFKLITAGRVKVDPCIYIRGPCLFGFFIQYKIALSL